MSIVDDLAELFIDEVTAVPGYTDWAGDFVASGAVSVIPCRIEGGARLVTDPATGREVVSRVQVICAGYFDLTADLHRYILPARFPSILPSGLRRAVTVDKVTDDEGPCYEAVYLP